MAQTFFPITPTEIVPGDVNDWVTMDASALVPANATGVILHCENTHATNHTAFGLRKNGSTDDRTEYVDDDTHFWAMIGVDASRYFEAYVGSTTEINIWIVGYTMAGVTFNTNADDMSLDTEEEWTAIDCSTEAPSAIGLIFEVSGPGGEAGIRKNGSTDDRHQNAQRHDCFTWIIGCDASQICEGYIQYAEYTDFFLVGYVTDGCTFNTNATDVSLGTEESWADLTALPDVSPAPNMGFIEVYTTLAGNYGLRKNGSGEDIFFRALRVPHGIVECDASRIIEGKIYSTVTDFFVVGYSTAVPEAQTINDAGAIASLEAFGTHQLNMAMSAAGAIASLEAFGTPITAGPITCTGIASLEAFGTHQLNLRVAPSAIASLEAFGTAQLVGGLLVSGIASLEAFGTPTLTLFLLPSAIASLEAFGTAQLNLHIASGGVASLEAFGTPVLTLYLLPGSITSLEAFGTPIVAGPITCTGISSLEAFGSPQLNLKLEPSAIASLEAFGTPTLILYLLPGSITSLEAFGTPIVAGPITCSGIVSAEAFGTPILTLYLLPSSITSLEVLGTPVVAGPIICTGIASLEAFGTPHLNLTLTISGIVSLEAFGTAQLNLTIFPSAIVSAEAFGLANVIIRVYPAGALGYIIEVRDSSDNLLAFLQNATGINLVEQLNRPPMLDFRLPADDSKISHINPDNEYWLRNYETGVLVRKFLLSRRRDTRD